ncbi:hypothetical protein [Pseudoclavibacter sp. RFBA6]|uniref:hypothetical protein n=1 Tax=Pseudoclavibacter sp. RFBA6 TaxID=2080573 RepID=UPI0011AFE95B|nr:hypothetical protein [Pseudoclavibacter sp. RFBA6]
MNIPTTDEQRRLDALHAVGFEDFSLAELRYEDMVEQDRAALRAAAHSDSWRRAQQPARHRKPPHQAKGNQQ